MITFRLMTNEDLEFFSEVRNSCAKEYLHDSRQFSLEETIKWFAVNPKTNNYYIIESEGTKIGYFRTSNYSVANKNIYVGSDIHEKYRGLGIGFLAYKMFISYLFVTFDLHKVSLEVLSTNVRAIHLYKKLGFIEEGRKRDEIKKDDTYVDSIIMSILDYEWKERLAIL